MSTDNTNQLTPDESKKVGEVLGNILSKKFDEDQERPDQYVVEYRKKSDDSLLGYHASSFCQLTQDRLSGKRYSGDNPYNQLAIIHKNVSNVLKTTAEDDKIFDSLKFKVKEAYFNGLTIDDIYIQADYLDEDTPKQTFVFNQLQ